MPLASAFLYTVNTLNPLLTGCLLIDPKKQTHCIKTSVSLQVKVSFDCEGASHRTRFLQTTFPMSITAVDLGPRLSLLGTHYPRFSSLDTMPKVPEAISG